MASNTIYSTKHFLNFVAVQINTNSEPPCKPKWSEVIKSFPCIVPLHPLSYPRCCLCPHFPGWGNWGLGDLAKDTQLASDKSKEPNAGLAVSRIALCDYRQLRGWWVWSNWRVVRAQWKVAPVSNYSIPCGCTQVPWCWNRELCTPWGQGPGLASFPSP